MFLNSGIAPGLVVTPACTRSCVRGLEHIFAAIWAVPTLRDLDLHTRLLRHRCSYMVYSPTFTGLPPSLRRRVDRALDRALDVAMPEPVFAYLPAEEKSAIRTILRETLTPGRDR
jgi:hypothetical protein